MADLTATRSLRLSPEQRADIGRVAAEQDRAPSQVIRRAVAAYVAAHDREHDRRNASTAGDTAVDGEPSAVARTRATR